MPTYRRPPQQRMAQQPEGCTPVMAYVPVQVLDGVYEPYQGFCIGTMFPDLNKPFKRGGVVV